MNPPSREKRSAIDEHGFIEWVLDETGDKEDGFIWAWNPSPHIALGPRSHREPFLSRINEVADRFGLEVAERNTGGLPVVHDGDTVGFAWTEEVSRGGRDVEERYRRASSALREALNNLGVDPVVECRSGEICMGRYSLYLDGKVAGISQRVKKSAALTSGVVFLDSSDGYAEVVEEVYSAIGEELDIETIDSLSGYIDVDTADVIEEVVDVFQRGLGANSV